jgi:hypothetical protein
MVKALALELLVERLGERAPAPTVLGLAWERLLGLGLE